MAGEEQEGGNAGERLMRDAGVGLFGRAKNMVTGFFGGIFGGGLFWTGVTFLLQSTGAARPIAHALGGEEMANAVANMGGRGDPAHPNGDIGQRLINSAIIGAAMGGAGGAAKGLVNGDGRSGLIDNVVGIGASLVAAAVVVGAVKDGRINLPGGTPAAGSPRPAAEPVIS